MQPNQKASSNTLLKKNNNKKKYLKSKPNADYEVLLVEVLVVNTATQVGPILLKIIKLFNRLGQKWLDHTRPDVRSNILHSS